METGTENEVAWRPSADIIADANLTRFMAAHGIADYDALLAKSDSDPEWFWDTVIRHFGIRFYKPYERIMDTSQGLPWTRWCVGGTTNIVLNCLDAHQDHGREAVVWGGRRRPDPDLDSGRSKGRNSPFGRWPRIPRHRQGGRCRPFHADAAGDCGRLFRYRQDRRHRAAAFFRLWRRLRGQPHERRRRRCRRDRRHDPAPRQDGADERDPRSGGGAGAVPGPRDLFAEAPAWMRHRPRAGTTTGTPSPGVGRTRRRRRRCRRIRPS